MTTTTTPTPTSTVEQGTGPLYSFALCFPGVEAAVDPATPGALRVTGRVLDGNGAPMSFPSVMIEFFSENAFARSQCNFEGTYEVTLPRPTTAAGEAPHYEVMVFVFPLSDHFRTRMYLPDQGEANAADPVLRTVPEERRETLVATGGNGSLMFDIRMQGDNETVFFS